MAGSLFLSAPARVARVSFQRRVPHGGVRALPHTGDLAPVCCRTLHPFSCRPVNLHGGDAECL